MRKRDFLKKQAVKLSSRQMWNDYKKAQISTALHSSIHVSSLRMIIIYSVLVLMSHLTQRNNSLHLTLNLTAYHNFFN